MSQGTVAVPSVILNDGREMPRIGYGVWRVPDTDVARAVSTALAEGHRLIDTAAAYGNEKGVGRGVAASGLPRSDVFITTKIRNADHGYDTTVAALEASLDRLGIECVNLCLIHWPCPGNGKFLETWRALIHLQDLGLTTSIGVCNFTADQLDTLITETGVTPAVNQIELHPMLPQREMRAAHRARDIITQAWSPLATGRLIDHPVLAHIARRNGRDAAQVLLRWNYQMGNALVTRSITPARIRSNLRIFDFNLSPADVALIAALDSGTRFGPHPDENNRL